MSHLLSLPGETDITDIFKVYPQFAHLLGDWAQHIMRGTSELEVGERELLFAFGSGENACSFCHNSHIAVAETYGIDPALFEALRKDIDAAPVSDRLKPILKYVRKLTRAPSTIVPRDVEEILAQGWSEKTVFDAAAVCALHNALNRIVDGLGVNVAAQKYAEIGKTLNAAGYGIGNIQSYKEQEGLDR